MSTVVVVRNKLVELGSRDIVFDGVVTSSDSLNIPLNEVILAHTLDIIDIDDVEKCNEDSNTGDGETFNSSSLESDWVLDLAGSLSIDGSEIVITVRQVFLSDNSLAVLLLFEPIFSNRHVEKTFLLTNAAAFEEIFNFYTVNSILAFHVVVLSFTILGHAPIGDSFSLRNDTETGKSSDLSDRTLVSDDWLKHRGGLAADF